MSLREVALGILELFLLIGPFGHLVNLICETLESAAVPGLMLSLIVEDANVIQEAFEFTRPKPILLVASRLFHGVYRMVCFPLLVVALG
jgi:predicted benzoate:H+ symporter BenE